MKNSVRVISVISAIGVLGTVGLTQIVSANSRSSSAATKGNEIAQMPDEEKDDNDNDDDDEEPDGADLQGMTTITLQQAIQAAENSAGSQAVGAGLEEEKDKIVYAVLVDGQEILIDVSNGEIISSEAERQAAFNWQPLATITLQQAIQTAESSTNGQAYSADLQEEDGGLVYEVAIARQEIYVDAGNGQVLYTETEGQDEDESTHSPSSVQVPQR